MTPQKQIEEVARTLDALRILQVDEFNNFPGSYEEGLSYAYEHAERLVRALLPLEVTDAMEWAGAKAIWLVDGNHTGEPNHRAKEMARACLSAALTQKGDNE